MTTPIPKQGMPASREAARPWWREPWPWLLMSGPLVAMAGCAVTIWLAMTHPDPPLADGVVRHGLVVEKADPAARARGPALPPSSTSAR